jgi:orotate phosphoribosyltransferase
MKHQLLLAFSFFTLQNTTCNSDTFQLLGYPLASRIGISACPLTTSEGIKDLAALGYDIITYKTIRSSHCPIQSSILYDVDINTQLTRKDFNTTVYAHERLRAQDKGLAITNSYGINSLTEEATIFDIAQTRRHLLPKQVLIVSVYGSGKNNAEQVDDFVAAARLAAVGGAHIIEANLSCPNLNAQEYVYKNTELVYQICKAITTHIPDLPLIIKVGVFDSIAQTKEILLAAHAGGARGICGINTVPMQVLDAQDNHVYGLDHRVSGVSGAPLLELALEFTREARSIIDEEKLALALLVTGGVIEPAQFDLLFAAGADIALCATGAMRNKKLAEEYHALHQENDTTSKKKLIKELYAIGAVKTGEFKLKSGMLSPIYFDMRLLISHPKLLHAIADECAQAIKNMDAQVLCGVPYAAVPLATLISSLSDIPQIMPRKEIKSHGTKKAIEGSYNSGDICVVIEDVVVSGESILETIQILENNTLRVKDIVVLIDREQGGLHNLEKKGYKVHALFTISEILHTLHADGIITDQQRNAIQNFCAINRTDNQA